VADEILSGKSQTYRAASEALHRDGSTQDRHLANLRKLWECGLAELIRSDFYGLFDFPDGERGVLLDAGCGTAFEAGLLARIVPGLRYYGVDISSLRLGEAAAAGAAEPSRFFQSALESLPFADGAFDYVGSHEVIEHVEDPAIVLPELFRVLKPGGVCVIATPNGASLWVEHIRQRLARLVGLRGAPVGEDHTRSPGFWRRQFERAGFVVERRIFDGAAFEFLTYVAPASWMTAGARLLEPLRIVPVVNLLLCDRVKYRLRRPGSPLADSGADPRPVCPLCRAALGIDAAGAICGNGHRFSCNSSGLIDFTSLLCNEAGAGPAETVDSDPVAGRSWLRKLRRMMLAAGCLIYLGFLGLLLPLGFVVGRFRQPLPR
jgi:SAM-dependent methyltransferase